ncbi:hypothetical protein HZA43_03475 [Candidatus Peregrinibacteria bacterium]|nr:hypothetical protein [Candidatus Peregrinibacteria bacterium]
MKKYYMVLIGVLINFSQALALATNETQITEPLGGDTLLGKTLFQKDVGTGIQGSFIFSKLIPFLIRYGIQLAVALAVIAIIAGGFQFIIAFGNTEKREAAQKTIIYAVIGLVIALTAYGIVKIITGINLV